MYVETIKVAIKILEDARDVLHSPSRWTKGWYARDNKGLKCSAISDEACRYCISGALYKVESLPTNYNINLRKAEQYLEDVMNTDHIPDVNDALSTKHKHILMAFDFAILMAKDDLRKAQRQARKGK